MTTIAWDGTTLAGDTLGIQCGLPRSVPKVFRLKDGRLFGGAGEYQEVLIVRDWLNGDGEKPDKLEDFSALIIKGSECFKLESKLILMPVAERFYAIGSGRDFAFAAMHLNQDARTAIEIASLFDVSTGGHIDTLTLEMSGTWTVIGSGQMHTVSGVPWRTTRASSLSSTE
jgi:hypothetical protein